MKQVKTARGKIIDMSAMAKKHETDRAVGNVPMNARGDRLDQKGNVKQTIQNISRTQHNATVPPQQATVSNPIPKEQPTPAVATSTEPQPINETTHTREDGSQYVEIEFDDGSIETRELGNDSGEE